VFPNFSNGYFLFTIVLHQPEIPPNTGNIIRLCANVGADLHLIRPLGFELADKALRRAGLDYHEYASVLCHDSWKLCKQHLAGRRFFACTTKGSVSHDKPSYQAGDVFVFGCETRGLPADLLEEFTTDQRIRIPMRAGQRSLNLSNAAAVITFEAWRQIGFDGCC
jgi:tRNA (cytidine/uridine-2'-O-)-methyltransferase